MPNPVCDIGLIGLAVMGQNLVLNMNDHGYKVAVFNRTTSKVDEFVQDQAKGTAVVGSHSIEEMCGLLKRPRRVMLMVKAGAVVDQTIQLIVPHLQAGDVIIDGGNSLFTDSERRAKELGVKDILFVGTGVSGGEEARGTALPSCQADILMRGRSSKIFLRRSRRRRSMDRLAANGSDLVVPVTTSRWCTTVSSMAICS